MARILSSGLRTPRRNSAWPFGARGAARQFGQSHAAMTFKLFAPWRLSSLFASVFDVSKGLTPHSSGPNLDPPPVTLLTQDVAMGTTSSSGSRPCFMANHAADARLEAPILA